MYGLDESVRKAYKGEDIDKGKRTPRFPTVAGSFGLDLLSVQHKNSDTHGDIFSMAFRVTRSNCDQVIVGNTYEIAYFKGGTKVQYEMFWRQITPPLLAVFGETQAESFDALGKLCELLQLSESGEELGLSLNLATSTETAKPKKGKTELEDRQKNEDGSPKVYRRDNFSAA